MHQTLSPVGWQALEYTKTHPNYPVKGQLTSHGQTTATAGIYMTGNWSSRPLSHIHHSLSLDTRQPLQPSGYISHPQVRVLAKATMVTVAAIIVTSQIIIAMIIPEIFST